MAATSMLRGGDADPLWAQAAELERQFEGYKRRLAERTRDAAMAAAVDRPGVGVHVDGAGEAEEAEVGRGRRYEAYVRRRDEKLRQGWLARMERKEAEVKALWARLDAGGRRRGPDDVGVTAASPAIELKPRSIEKPVPAATPRCISAMKLPRLRSAAPSSSPAAAAASPRLPSSRRSSHPEPPTTPRKENRMPPPSTAAASPRPPKTLSRARSSLKDTTKVKRSSGSSSSSSSSVRESPRPPRSQAPRATAPSPADAAIATARSRFHEQVVLAEIKTAAVVSPEPFRLGRSRIGVGRVSSPSVTPGQVDFLSRLGSNGRDDLETSERSGAEGKNSMSEAGGNGDKLGDAEITGDSDTEPSYVYIKRDQEEVGDEQEDTETFEETMASSSSEETDKTVKESPTGIGSEASPRDSSESLYSNVQSSFSHGSELDASAAGSPFRTPPPASGALSTEELLESDAAMLRMKREDEEESNAAMLRTKREEEEEEEEADDQSMVFLPRNCCTARSGAVPFAGRPQSPMEAVAGLKRFLTFGKKNGKGADDAAAAVVVIERAPPSAGDGSASQGSASGDTIKPRTCWSDAASDDLDNSYVMSPQVRSLQSFVQPSPARSQLKEMALTAKSPRVNRSFFSFSSFKNRGN